MELAFNLHEIHAVAEAFLRRIGDHKVIAFHGGLGAGKTTLISAICSIKKVTGGVSSPTYSIINEYEGEGERIFHIDLYRLKDEQEVLQAGVEDCLYSGDLCLVEWPERAASLFPAKTVHVYLEATGQLTRRIVIGDN